MMQECNMHQRRTAFCHLIFSSKGVKPIEIHRGMKVQYGDACLSLQQVYEWTRKFMKSFRSDEEVQQAVHEWLRSSQKNFFLEVSMHFRSAGTQWRLHRKMKSLCTLCSINYEIENNKVLRFSFDSPSYMLVLYYAINVLNIMCIRRRKTPSDHDIVTLL
jgi:hypothetical protein